ncbi:hypothetical protein ACFLQ8_03205 [Candidatus Auribacterota bacterium]
MKALGLISGGLDSQLAIRLILDQGIDVEAVYFSNIFATSAGMTTKPNIATVIKELGNIPLHIVDVNKEMLSIVKKPRYGYGSAMNPCIDCRIMSFMAAKKLMKKIGAKFIITGEVLGQRPMSQRKDTIKLIEKNSTLEGYIVRPLSAKILPTSIPEEKGWINREKLLDVSGRSRKTQIELANKYGFKAFSTPAGGCLLTEKLFANRLRESYAHKEDKLQDIETLKLGRHFRIHDKIKCIVGRNEKENDIIEELAQPGDIIIRPVIVPGPTLLLRNCSIENSPEYFNLTTTLFLKYCKIKENVTVEYGTAGKKGIEWKGEITVSSDERSADLPGITHI